MFIIKIVFDIAKYDWMSSRIIISYSNSLWNIRFGVIDHEDERFLLMSG